MSEHGEWCVQTITPAEHGASDSWLMHEAAVDDFGNQYLARLSSPDAGLRDGAALISAERRRQIEVEHYDADHDAEHGDELARAGATYALPLAHRVYHVVDRDEQSVPMTWPWTPRDWKPGDRIRELVKAGALIAAAIDALHSESGGDPR